MILTRKQLTFGLIFWFILWDLVRRIAFKDSDLFPSTLSILINMFDLFFISRKIYYHLFSSLTRFFIACAFAIPIGYGLGIIAASNRLARILMQSIVSLTYPLPKVALIPIILILFGTGDFSKIVLIYLGVFYLIYLNVFHRASELLNGSYKDILQVYQVHGKNYWYDFLIKGTYSSFLIGLKMALGYGLTLVVVSEMSLSNSGMGYFIWSAWDSYRMLDMYSGVCIIAIISLFINYFCDKLIGRQQLKTYF
ncbi:MAG: ABC transporter permease subunit [Pseudobdellovibrio sp.]